MALKRSAKPDKPEDDGPRAPKSFQDIVEEEVPQGKELPVWFELFYVPGNAKAQPHDAKLLTPHGWTAMGEIVPGEYVIGGGGQPAMVLGVYPQGPKIIYRVTMSDGSSTECCDEHLWLTHSRMERSYHSRVQANDRWECAKPHVRQLSEIRGNLESRDGAKNFSIPLVTHPVVFAPQAVPVEPYLLGVLLGDGCLRDSLSFSSADPEIVAAVSAGLPERLSLHQMNDYDYRISGPTQWAGLQRAGSDRHPLKGAIRSLGLMGSQSHEKFIPDVYKYNSSECRLAILQGLMDTDGTISDVAQGSVFCSTSQRLADDLRFLVQSLGGTVTIGTQTTTYTYLGERHAGKLSYRVRLRLPPSIEPFRLTRKAALVHPLTKYPPVRYITGVELVGEKVASCILVDDPQHLYVTDDFIVTHNTSRITETRPKMAMPMVRMNLMSKAVSWTRKRKPLMEQWVEETDERMISIDRKGKLEAVELHLNDMREKRMDAEEEAYLGKDA